MNQSKQEKVRCTIYLEHELWDSIKSESDKQKRPFSSQCEILIEDAAPRIIKGFKKK